MYREEHTFRNIRKSVNQFLNFFREYIFSVLENDYILLSAADEYISLGIYISQISRVEPTVRLQHLIRGNLIVVISKHHTVALYDKFSYAVFIRLIDSYLKICKLLSNGARFDISICLGCYCWRSFGKTIAAHRENTKIV